MTFPQCGHCVATTAMLSWLTFTLLELHSINTYRTVFHFGQSGKRLLIVFRPIVKFLPRSDELWAELQSDVVVEDVFPLQFIHPMGCINNSVQ